MDAMSQSQTEPQIERTEQHSLIIRALWFIFIGWWASGIWLTIAWLLNLSLIGIPLGIKMINKVPFVISLRKRSNIRVFTEEDGRINVTESGPKQHSLPIRGVWFVFIGWWASGLWMLLAWVFSITIVGLPVAVAMYSYLPYIVSLYKMS